MDVRRRRGRPVSGDRVKSHGRSARGVHRLRSYHERNNSKRQRQRRDTSVVHIASATRLDAKSHSGSQKSPHRSSEARKKSQNLVRTNEAGDVHNPNRCRRAPTGPVRSTRDPSARITARSPGRHRFTRIASNAVAPSIRGAEVCRATKSSRRRRRRTDGECTS